MLKTIYKLRFVFFFLLWVLWTLLQYLYQPEVFLMIWIYVKANPWETLVNIVAVFTFFDVILFLVRWRYAEKRAKAYLFMKVILPRDDSKLDQEKKTEKDFKEKVSIMAQLYRALSEISELNLKNTFRTFIFQNDQISFELFLEDNQLNFYVVCHPYFQKIVEKQITAYYPSAEISLEEPYEIKQRGSHLRGFYLYAVKNFWYPILTYKNMENDPLNDMGNVLSKLEKDEKAVIQIIINPCDDDWQKEAQNQGTLMFKNKKKSLLEKIPIIWPVLVFIINLLTSDSFGTNAPGASGGDSYVRMLQPKEEAAKRVGEKAGQPGFDTTIRILASGKTAERTEEICNNMTVAFTIFKDSYGNWFQNRRIVPIDLINMPILYHSFKKRLGNFFHKSSLLVPEELATIFHFPDAKYNQIPIIKWLQYKILPPPVDLPKEGVLLGYNVFRGVKTPIHMLKNDRTRHHYIIGKSGSGKSVMLSYMARQDIQNGDGCCVIDPHGDLIEEILTFIPKERAKDVVIFDPSDTERPMGLNLLEAYTPEEKDRASLDAMQIFIKMFGNEIFGPRIQHYFRNGCLTLMDDEEEWATLIDVPRLFVDDEFQKYKVGKIKNPVVKAFWYNEMAKTGQREKEEMIPYFSSKFGPFITNTTMRNIIGQPKSAFNIREIMDNQKILLVNLSKGKIGETNAQLLGLIIVNKINMAAMSRVDIPAKNRKDFFLYVDEFQNFATDAFADILSEARKYRLALIMAHQYINQLTQTPTGQQNPKIRDAVFGNVGTMMSFKIGAEDADYLAKEYAPTLSEQDIIGIANYKAYIKLNINNTTSRPFSLETVYDMNGSNEKIAEIVKKYSRLKYGRKKLFVDQEIEGRLGIIT